MTIETLQTQINEVLAQLQLDPLRGDELKLKYLGKKGLFNQISSQIKDISNKKTAGELINTFKSELTHVIDNKQTTTSIEKIDLTTPPLLRTRGHIHPISQAITEITRIFENIGFLRVRYPEVDTDYNAFTSLNMPENHPARDEWETFFVDYPGKTKTSPTLVLTPHTSNGQTHELTRLATPPVRMINISRCYRRQQDATHTQMFHQFEGTVVDKKISIANLKGVLNYFAESFYGPGTKSRLRPFHFQFTEPSFEIDFSCHICTGTGYVEKNGEKTKCKFCKSGWHEVGGAGMIHPNDLKMAGYDPDKVSGFAFGWGVERTYTLREGLGIDDIRGFYNGNLEFLAQF